MLGKSNARMMTKAEMAALAESIKVHPADVHATIQVESTGKPNFDDGTMKILFEPHKFYAYLPKEKREEAIRLNLATTSYKETKRLNYYNKWEATSDDRYKLLQKAINFDSRAAFMAISMGAFQIMGFNHAVCGYSTPRAMFDDFCQSMTAQAEAFILFLRSKNLIKALRSRDFQAIESGYNGGGLNGEYARRMKAASDKLRSTVWKDYTPGSIQEPAPKPEPKPEVTPPAVPEGLDKVETKSKTLWSSLLAIIGSPIAFFAGLPEYVKILIIAVIIAGAAVIIYERLRYAKEARRLRSDYILAAAKGVATATIDRVAHPDQEELSMDEEA